MGRKKVPAKLKYKHYRGYKKSVVRERRKATSTDVRALVKDVKKKLKDNKKVYIFKSDSFDEFFERNYFHFYHYDLRDRYTYKVVRQIEEQYYKLLLKYNPVKKVA